jgi:hypothetical protein
VPVVCPGCGGKFQAECEAARCACNLPWLFGAANNDSDDFVARPSDNASDDVVLEATISNGWWPESPSTASDLDDVADFLSGLESSPSSETQAEERSQPGNSAYALASIFSPSAAGVSGGVDDPLFRKRAVRMDQSASGLIGLLHSQLDTG